MQKNYDSFKTLSFFASLCLFLSAIEFAIPKPLPFLRLGLTNMSMILSLFILTKKDYIILIFLKILCQSLIGGTLLSYIFIFSFFGSLSSGFTMLILHTIFFQDKIKSKHLSIVGLSLSGSLSNNLCQLFISKIILFGDSTKYIAPILLISGFITGLFLGLFLEEFIKKSAFFKKLRAKHFEDTIL